MWRRTTSKTATASESSKTAAVTASVSSKTSAETCCVCCQSLNPAKDEALFCAGSCQQWAHRYCAGVSVMAYKAIREKGRQFRCFACHQISHDDEIGTAERSGPALFAGFRPGVF